MGVHSGRDLSSFAVREDAVNGVPARLVSAPMPTVTPPRHPSALIPCPILAELKARGNTSGARYASLRGDADAWRPLRR